jgi:hypothetical protein
VPDLPIYVRNGAITAGNMTIDYNDYQGTNVGSWNEGGITNFATWKTNCSCDSHSINADPQLVGVTTSNFQLQPSSPAIGVGLTLSSVPIDFNGVVRPAGSYDMGAYQ